MYYACFHSFAIVLSINNFPRQLHDKFVMLKKQHAEQKERFEDKKRQLDDEMKEFQKRKFSLESRIGTLGTLKSTKKK